MPDLSYSAMNAWINNGDWLARVQIALLQTVVNVKIVSPPPSGGSTTLAARRDLLGRSVLASPTSWAHQFAPVIAMAFFGSTGPEAVTDGQIFSALDAIYDDFLPVI